MTREKSADGRKEMNIAARAYAAENDATSNLYAGSNLTVRSIALQPSLSASEASSSRSSEASGSRKRRYGAELAERHVGTMFADGGLGRWKDFGRAKLTSSKSAGSLRLPACPSPR